MKFVNWLLADLQLPHGVQEFPRARDKTAHQHAWWRVMCLTGVDYFSTLGYQPGIAFLAAGLLSPIATLVLVLVTLFAALPVYRRVAAASPNGQGSIAMLEKIFPEWGGKVFVLVLLGFATTDFIITMTLSAADAGAHFVSNPFTLPWMKSQFGVTLFLLAILGAIFLKGFKEAIGIAVVLVGIYLALNGIVTVYCLAEIVRHPHVLPDWKHALFVRHSNPFAMIGIALLLFPRLALGLSGFETGVAVMPLVEGGSSGNNGTDDELAGRIRNTRKLLTAAASIMSVFLIATALVTTLLIPASAFAPGGAANGRAMAYLAHRQLGGIFGSVYDISTILILAFAGASAMAGLLNLIPRYLPRFGMAPEWMRASRPLVLVFTGVAFAVTWLFHANVDAQGGAYATGVLVLITSAAFAVAMIQKSLGRRTIFFTIAFIFVYTTAANVYERPEGLKIASVFILTMIVSSVLSRAIRSTELRITEVEVEPSAWELLKDCPQETLRLVPRKRQEETEDSLRTAAAQIRYLHSLEDGEKLVFFEIERGDASEFTHKLHVGGERIGEHCVLYARSPVVANAVAAFLLHLERETGNVPHSYFRWREGNPLANIVRYLFLGEGDTAPLTHEVIRRAMPDEARRPVVHVA
ncbi:MAG: amino acid transporter [Acidobacteriaceae bacterium]